MRSHLIYRPWHLAQETAMPQRTYLYRLQPLGSGSIYVESLTGYIARLAEAHDVSPAMLMNRELLPRMGKWAMAKSGARKATLPLNSTFIYQSHVLNGAGEYPQNCVHVLEDLTESKGLRTMTLLGLGNVVSPQHLLRNRLAWCATCFEEWRCSASPIYQPLLWAIECVTHCPTHLRELSVRCPHCGQVLYILSARSRPGYCCRCQQWLGQPCDPDRPSKCGQAGVSVAHSIGDILAAGATPNSFSSELHKANLKRCIGSLTEGSIKRFCVATGITYDSAANWLSANGRIRLELLVSVCTRLGLHPLRFLSEPLADPDFDGAREVIQRNTAHLRTLRPQARINEQLARALRQEPPVSMHDVAAKLGYSSAMSLRRRNPELCDQISNRYRQSTIRIPVTPLLSAIPSNDTIRRALDRALAQHPRIPLKTVARSLGFRNVVSLYNRFPDMCRAFAVANKADRARRLEPMRVALLSALTENPPPSLPELASRLGCTDATLQYRFPELRAALLERQPERKRLINETLISIFQRASIEEPPPSTKTVAARAGKKEDYLRANHPDLFKIIQRRHHVKRTSDAASRRAVFRTEIACAVAELRQRGITPSRLRVFAAIRNPSMRSTRIIDQQIVATLKELEASPVATGGKY